MKRADIIAAMHTGIENAAREYAIWSGGLRLNESGVENLVTTSIARHIWNLIETERANHRLSLEAKFAEIRDESGSVNKQGRPSRSVASVNKKGSGRVDVTIWNGAGKPVGLVEVKRSSNAKSAAADVKRLVQLVEASGPSHSGSVQYGLFGLYVHRDLNAKSEPLDRKIDKVFEEVEKVLPKAATIVKHAAKPFTLPEAWGGEKLEAASLVIEIKAKYGPRGNGNATNVDGEE